MWQAELHACGLTLALPPPDPFQLTRLSKACCCTEGISDSSQCSLTDSHGPSHVNVVSQHSKALSGRIVLGAAGRYSFADLQGGGHDLVLSHACHRGFLPSL